MRCPKCGFDNSNEMSFCGGCGSPLSQPQQNYCNNQNYSGFNISDPLGGGSNQAQHGQFSNVQQQPMNYGSPVESAPQNNTMKVIVIAIISAAVVIAVSLVAFFAFSGDDEDTKPRTNQGGSSNDDDDDDDDDNKDSASDSDSESDKHNKPNKSNKSNKSDKSDKPGEFDEADESYDAFEFDEADESYEAIEFDEAEEPEYSNSDEEDVGYACLEFVEYCTYGDYEAAAECTVFSLFTEEELEDVFGMTYDDVFDECAFLEDNEVGDISLAGVEFASEDELEEFNDDSPISVENLAWVNIDIEIDGDISTREFGLAKVDGQWYIAK